MRSEIIPVTSKIEITAVRDIEVSETVDDGEGGYIRSLKIFGEPAGSSSGGTLVFEVLVRSETETDLDIATPVLTF